MEFQLTVSVSHHGHDLVNGEKFSHGFAVTHPESGAVVEQNVETGVISVTIWYTAEDFREAAERGAAIFTEGATASGLEPSDFLDARMSVVDPDHETDKTRELQPA